jgi:hypothetical protein
VKDRRVLTAPNAQVEQAHGLKYKMRPMMDWDYMIKIARDDGGKSSK